MGNPLAITTTAANGAEREEAEKLTTTVKELRKLGERMTISEADKEYDTDWLRRALLIAQIFPLIPYRKIKDTLISGLTTFINAKRRFLLNLWLREKWARKIADHPMQCNNEQIK